MSIKLADPSEILITYCSEARLLQKQSKADEKKNYGKLSFVYN